MCDTLVTADGIELRTLGEAARYGIAISPAARNHHGDDWCLCVVDLETTLNKHPSTWREGFAMPGDGWCEVGPDGRTWWDGYDIRTEDPKYPRSITISRSDRRSAMTLEEWEAAQPNPGAGHV